MKLFILKLSNIKKILMLMIKCAIWPNFTHVHNSIISPNSFQDFWWSYWCCRAILIADIMNSVPVRNTFIKCPFCHIFRSNKNSFTIQFIILKFALHQITCWFEKIALFKATLEKYSFVENLPFLGKHYPKSIRNPFFQNSIINLIILIY